jgi:hypothetical protein
MGKSMGTSVRVEVVLGDVLLVGADILALKYARRFYGVDAYVATMLRETQDAEITLRSGAFGSYPPAVD